VLVAWETVAELDNAGFNLYRGPAPDAAPELLAYLPSQAPGSGQGAEYHFQDVDVAAGQTWYYWLDAVDLDGAATRHGPVSVAVQTPTAVQMVGLAAQASSAAAGPALTAGLLLLLAGSGAAILLRRRLA
jgi:hypothetical protein